MVKIPDEGRGQDSRAFTELQSHYLSDDRARRPGKGNDKGNVEGLVSWVGATPVLRELSGAQSLFGCVTWTGWTPSSEAIGRS